MASTSNGIHGGDGNAENRQFSLDLVLTSDVPLPPFFEYLDAPGPASPNSVDGGRAHRIPGGEEDANSVPTQILQLSQLEIKAIQLIHPGAKIQENRITTEEYKFVLKLLLFNRKVSGDDMSAVPHPLSIARILRRLSRELRSADTGGFKFACTPDPLDDLLEDIQETDGESLEASEETEQSVYVKGNIDLYVDYLLSAASELSTC